MKSACVLIGIILCVARIAFAESSDTSTRQDGFCGLDAARICASQLGIPWRSTSQVSVLETEPLVNFGAVSQALESLGLTTEYCVLDRNTLATIRSETGNPDAAACGIAWIQSDSLDMAENAIGHFVIVDSISFDGHVRMVDPQTMTVSSLQINDGLRLPMLWAMRLNGQPTQFGVKALFRDWLHSRVSLTLLVLFFMSLCFACLAWRRHGKRQQIACAAIVFAILATTSWVTGRQMSAAIFSSSVKDQNLSQEIGFEKTSYDFGNLAVELNSEFQLLVINRTSRQQKVSEVRVSCSCMEIKPSSFDIEPNSQQVVNVKFNALSEGFNRFFAGIYVGEAEVAKCEMHFSGVRSLRLLPLSGIVGSLSDSDSESPLIHQLSFDGELPGPIQSVKLIPGPKDTPLMLRMVKTDLDIVNELTLAVSLCDDIQERGFYYETVGFEVMCADQTMIVDTEIGVDIVD